MNKQSKILFEAGWKKFIYVFALTFIFSVGAAAQAKTAAGTPTLPADFKNDGCTHFPDADYVDCCVEHDKTYFVGGSWTMRWRADKKLYKCVAAKKGFEHKLIAPVMWAGVRVFGVPFLPTSFRWGFGKTEQTKSSGGKTQKSVLNNN